MRVLGYAIFAVAGLYMWIVETIAFYVWWDLTGVVVSLFVPPLAAAFPLVFWLKTGFLPAPYIVAWIAGFAGLALASLGDRTA